MKFQKITMALLALISFMGWSCSDEDDEPVVGITSVSVTPAGSAVSYSCKINGLYITSDSVAWDVSDAALANANVKVVPTVGAEAYYNNEVVGSTGLTIDVTQPVQLTVKNGNGTEKVYTLEVPRSESVSGDDMVLKSSALQGFPEGIIDYDMAFFNNKFYAFVSSLKDSIENYDLLTSEDGVNWTKVAYQVETAGVTLPEGQNGYVIGGEGAKLQVFNGRLYVMGGARLKGADIYGNPANVEDWGFMMMESIPEWISYSTADGITFKTDTIGVTCVDETGAEASMYAFAGNYFASEVFNGKMYLKGGYAPTFGQWQGQKLYAYTANGTDWVKATPKLEDGTDCIVKNRLQDSFFEFKGKLWSIGGFINFLDANYMGNVIYSSEDGATWTEAGTVPEAMMDIYGAKVVANENVAYMFGGQMLNATEPCNKVFRTEDGINWEEVEVPATYKGRRNPAGVAVGNAAWIFGKYSTTISSGFYAYPEATDILANDTWVKLMN